MENRPKKKIYKRWWFWAIIVVAIGIIASLGNEPENNVNKPENNKTAVEAPKKEQPKEQEAQNKQPPKEETKVSYENFMKIKMGAKYDEVKTLLGEGTEESSSEIGGTKTTLYSWTGPGISNMNVTIQNGIVTGKAQAGLMDMDAKITLEQYNKVKEGMTYQQTKAILGEGQITSQTKIMSTESIMYSWINKNGSNMNATFTGGKMVMKAQFNLK